MTIQGAFFGDGAGREWVTIENYQGETKSCRIVDWGMDSITFVMPSGIPGRFNLTVGNAVGTDTQPGWGTFAPPPSNPPNLLGTAHGGPETRNVASAVKYRDKLWFFWSDKDKDDNNVQYQTWDGASSWSGENNIVAGSETQKSHGVITPVVVDDMLYVFFVGLNSGNLHYVIYNPLVVDESKRWQGKYSVGNASMSPSDASDVGGRFGAVYNWVKKRLEVCTIWEAPISIFS